MTEHEFTREWGRMLTQVGCYVYPLVAGKMQPAGFPDRYVVGPGIPGLWIEAKRGKGKLREIQKVWHERALKAGVPVLILRDLGSKTSFEVWDYRNKQYQRLLWDFVQDGKHLRLCIQQAVRRMIEHGFSSHARKWESRD